MLHVSHRNVLHVPHVPHHDLRHLARDVAIAAEVVLASVALTGSVALAERGVASRVTTTPAMSATPAASVVVADAATSLSARPVHIDLAQDTTGVVADVYLPADGTTSLRIVDGAGTVVQTLAVTDAATAPVDLPPGTYRLLAAHEGRVEQVGDVAVSSSSVVRSDALVFEHTGRVTVRVHVAG